MRSIISASISALAVIAATAAFGQQRVVSYYGDMDPTVLEGMQKVMDAFQEANPDIKIEFQNFDHEGYKTSIRNFLTAEPPDVVNWYSGNRMAPFVNSGQFLDVSDVWEENGLKDAFSSALASMTIDGKQWGIPWSYYQWGIYYNRDVYNELGLEVPSTWDEFLANCEVFKKAGVDCLTTGTKALWPAAGIFDYLDLRTNGYDFHMALTGGEVPWTDDRVKAVFAEWDKLVAPGYITANHAALDWQDAAALMVQGKAANYVMGNFLVAVLKEGGMSEESIGFMPFPTINPDVPRAEDAPTESMHIPAGAKNPEDAKKFLAFVATPEAQSVVNATIGQLPVNKNAEVADDPFVQAGFELLSTTPGGIAQFFDRDAPAEMAKIGMEGFQQFMVQPGQLDNILDRLEKARQRVYK
ncbi:ABC transporter substrate-binding protein [Tropicimonas sp. IMCC34043]|uniref:ABC transporter substrate-binding protein n=1 Tax=Tropicimonas sp. IMCC34043 TaxID=2248760 RepID=UPI000E27EE23|nr:extracellular solute-binding protein [Tropicimonas sp. IMCC34043]